MQPPREQRPRIEYLNLWKGLPMWLATCHQNEPPHPKTEVVVAARRFLASPLPPTLSGEQSTPRVLRRPFRPLSLLRASIVQNRHQVRLLTMQNVGSRVSSGLESSGQTAVP